MSKYVNDRVHFVNILDADRFLTQTGKAAFKNESTKWDVIRVFHWMHQYAPSANDLESGDYFYGPRFDGDGLTPNIFKFSIHEYEYDYECKFEQVEYNESNSKKVNKDILIDDFAWFKAPTGNALLLLLFHYINKFIIVYI